MDRHERAPVTEIQAKLPGWRCISRPTYPRCRIGIVWRAAPEPRVAAYSVTGEMPTGCCEAYQTLAKGANIPVFRLTYEGDGGTR
jgi:hypothetical protein